MISPPVVSTLQATPCKSSDRMMGQQDSKHPATNSNKRQKKNQHLQFNESVRVKFHIHINDMSRSEIHAMWYSGSELQRKLQRRKRCRSNPSPPTTSYEKNSSPACTATALTTPSPGVSSFCLSSLNQELFDLGPSMMSSCSEEGQSDDHHHLPQEGTEDESDSSTSEEGSSIMEPKKGLLLPPSPRFSPRKRRFLAMQDLSSPTAATSRDVH